MKLGVLTTWASTKYLLEIAGNIVRKRYAQFDLLPGDFL